MVLHDPERIKKSLIAPLAVLSGDLGHALKTVSQVRSGQAGNIARAEVQSGRIWRSQLRAGAFSHIRRDLVRFLGWCALRDSEAFG